MIIENHLYFVQFLITPKGKERSNKPTIKTTENKTIYIFPPILGLMKKSCYLTTTVPLSLPISNLFSPAPSVPCLHDEVSLL